jgi:hypothetical protein
MTVAHLIKSFTPRVIASAAKQSSHGARWIATSPAAPRNDENGDML